MKYSLIIIVIVFIKCSYLYSQDIIFLKEYSDTIYCKIIKDNISTILYQKTNFDDTVIYSIKTAETEGYVQENSKLTNSELQKYNNQSNNLLFEEGKKNLPQAGIYLTYEQFKNKTPLLKDSIYSIYHKGGRLFFIPKKNGKADTLMGQVKFREEVWGYCNGQSILIHYWGNFFNLLTTGKYCLFIKENGNNGIYAGGMIGGLVGGAIMASTGTTYSEAVKLIDFETGNIINLYYSTVKDHILSQDPELLQQFLSEPEKRDVNTIITYVNKFNIRNPIK